MITPEKEFASVVIWDESLLLLARRPNIGLDLIGTEVRHNEEYSHAAKRALRELAHIRVRELVSGGTIDSLTPPIIRHHMFKGQGVIGWPRGSGNIEVAKYTPRYIREQHIPVSFVLGAVLEQINKH